MIVTNFTPVLIIEIYYIYLVLLGGWDVPFMRGLWSYPNAAF